MSTITDPNIFAGRLSRDCMNGWVAFKTGPNLDDVAVKLGRYPVIHAGGGRMRLTVDIPEGFTPVDCNRAMLFSRKGRMLHEFALEGVITAAVEAIVWIPYTRKSPRHALFSTH